LSFCCSFLSKIIILFKIGPPVADDHHNSSLAESGSRSNNKHGAVSPFSPAIAVRSDEQVDNRSSSSKQKAWEYETASHGQDADDDEDTFNIRSSKNKKAGK
jgi:hypothetical protein